MKSATLKFTFALLSALLFFIVKLSAQPNRNDLDSLTSAMESAKSDEAKCDLLVLVADKLDCSKREAKIEYLSNALVLSQKGKNSGVTMKIYSKLGFLYFMCTKNYLKAIEYNEAHAQLAKQENDKQNEAQAFNALAQVYKAENNFQRAIEYYKLAISLKPGDEAEMQAWANMAVIYQNVGDGPKALSCYLESYKSLDLFIKSKKKPDQMDSIQQGGLLLGIGQIYLETKEFDKALENFNKALKISGGSKSIALLVLMAKGETFKAVKKYQSSEEQYKAALVLCRESHDQNESSILEQLATINIETGKFDIALSFANNALKSAEQTKMTNVLPDIYISLAAIHSQFRQYGLAISYLKKAVNLAENIGFKESQLKAWQSLSTTYEAMKKPAEAFDAFKQYISLRDSLYNIDKANELTRIDLESGFARKQLADSLGQVKQSKAYEMRIQRQKLLAMSGYAGLALVVLLSFFIYRNYSQQKKANLVISKANEAIKEEKQVSENLLLNILPEEVARELKAEGAVQAKMFDNVTVLFTDFVNFTAAGERFTPQELVAELHACFKGFDEILERYPIEKIKTVGDAYLAVSGLPNPDENHAYEMVKAALEIRDFMVQRRKELGNSTFEIRIGVNSGTVVAGIVGVKKFAYDIWGDTVNTAARMEQYCEKGRVNISESTHELVKDKFMIVQRGKIAVKNKGELNMYFVEG